MEYSEAAMLEVSNDRSLEWSKSERVHTNTHRNRWSTEISSLKSSEDTHTAAGSCVVLFLSLEAQSPTNLHVFRSDIFEIFGN